MRRYISPVDYEYAKYCKSVLDKSPGDVWVEPIVPQRFAAMPLAMTAWQYEYLKIDDFIEKAVAEAIKNNRRVRVYVQDTSDVWQHSDLKPYYKPALSRNYTNSPSGEVHGHSHMVGGQLVGGNSRDIKIGLIRRFAEEGLVEFVLQKVLNDSGSGSFTGITEAHQDVLKDEFDGAKFVNMSYGGPSSYAPLSEVMKQGKELGIFYFASIGNSGYKEGEDRSGFPGNDESTIGCASIDSTGNRSYFSSVDSSRIAMFMAAPGSAVPTTLKDGTYGSVNGTSFSCPNSCAMGVIEYLLNPSITNQTQLEEEFIKDLTDHGLQGRDKFLGYGVPVMSNSFFPGDNPPPPPLPIPKAPVLISPINNEILEEDEVKFIWNAATYAISYTIQVIDKLGRPVLERTTTGTFYNYKLLDGEYRWRVKSLGSNGNSDWSSFADFSVKVAQEPVLDPPNLISPSNNEVLDKKKVTLKWNKVEEADSYYVLVESDEEEIVYDEIIYNTETTIELENGVYTWIVKSIKNTEVSRPSIARIFIVKVEKETVWPKKETIISLDTVFESRYKVPSEKDLRSVKFTVDVSHSHTSNVNEIYDIIRDRLRSHYSRSYVSFSKDTIDDHVALYYFARFTKILLKDIDVKRIRLASDIGVLIENEDLKRVPAQDIEASINYLW